MKFEHFDRQLLDPDLFTAAAFEALWGEPPEPAAFARAAQRQDARSQPHIAALGQVLHDYNRQIGNDDTALRNCEALAQPDTLAVVTGQQAGLFTGPLYTVYKIATAINLARRLSDELGRLVVPIFWNASEDHDRSEIASFRTPGAKWEADLPRNGIAAERMDSDPVVALRARYLENLSDAGDRASVASLTEVSHPNYSEYCSALISRLFHGRGLVVLEPRLLRKEAGPFFAQTLADNAKLQRLLADGAQQMAANGFTPPFEPGTGTGLFHIASSGVRRRILTADNGFVVDGQQLTPSELQGQVHESPHDFSTGVYLRPVWQCLRLPVLAYVGGPAEIQYHLQLKPIFKHFDATQPVLWPRSHGTLLTDSMVTLAERLSMSHADYFSAPDKWYHAAALPPSLHAAFRDAEQNWSAAVDALADATSPLLPEPVLAGFRHRMHKELAKLEARATRAHSRSQGIDNAQIAHFFDSVYPGGKPQERQLNIMHFVHAAGQPAVNAFLDALDPYERRHYICQL